MLQIVEQYAVSVGSSVAAWDLTSGSKLFSTPAPRAAGSEFGYCTAAAITPDASRLVFVGEDCAIRMWDVNARCRLSLLGPKSTSGKRHLTALALTPDGRYCISPDPDANVLLTDLATGAYRQLQDVTTVHRALLEVSPDGRQFIVGEGFDRCVVGDLTSNRRRRIDSRIATFNGDGTIATVSAVGVSVLNKRDGVMNAWHTDHPSPPGEAAVAPNGLLIITAPGHPPYDPILAQLPPGSPARVSLEMLRGEQFAMAARAPMVAWRWPTGEKVGSLDGHTNIVRHIAFTPDSRYAITAATDRTARLWNLTTCECVGVRAYEVAIDQLAVRGSSVLISTKQSVDIYTIANHGCGYATQADGPFVTPTRIWRFGAGGATGRWDDNVTVSCPCCGVRFPLPQNTMRRIASISGRRDRRGLSDQILSNALWRDPELIAECRSCLTAVQCQPFIVDHAGCDKLFVPQSAPLRTFEDPSSDDTVIEESLSRNAFFMTTGHSKPEASQERVGRTTVSSSQPHPKSDAKRAAQLNLEYQQRRRMWLALPWWRRLVVKAPEPPQGI